MGNAARDARALAGDVARLRADIERYRAELRAVVDQFLIERGHHPDPNKPLTGQPGRRNGRARYAADPPALSRRP